MPAPVAGVTPELRNYLTGLESQLGRISTPVGFLPAYVTTSAQLTAANAAENATCWAIVSDLKTLAWSDGTHWKRMDTGAVII